MDNSEIVRNQVKNAILNERGTVPKNIEFHTSLLEELGLDKEKVLAHSKEIFPGWYQLQF